MPELLGRREISLPQTRPKANELIEEYLFYTDSGLCKSAQALLIPSIYMRDVVILYQNQDDYSVYENDFKSPWLWENGY